jgi:hypothetical protein
MTVSSARSAWTGAGFTGAFSSTPSGHGNYVVDVNGQTPKAGACVPSSSSMAVTSHKP